VEDATQRLWGVVERYVAAEGVELDDIEILGSGRVLRVVLDAQGGLGVDRIADLSRGISRLIDDHDPMQAGYTLEVTSPGLERTLRRPAQYRKSLGRELKVKTEVPVDGERNHRGVLLSADDEGFTLDEDGATATYRYRDVASARTVFVWDKGSRQAQEA
jgi:ribosome maturation factor RimP